MIEKPKINCGFVGRSLLLINFTVALIYLSWWMFPYHIGHSVLYGLLLFGEFYHVGMAGTFWLTLWPKDKPLLHIVPGESQLKSVDVFITVAGEPIDVVEKTARAAKNMSYPNHRVFILNDGYVAKKENWMEMEFLARKL